MDRDFVLIIVLVLIIYRVCFIVHSAPMRECAVLINAPRAPPNKPLARDQSASLEDWEKLGRTGKKFGFIMGEIGKRPVGKTLRNGHFGLVRLAVSESWLKPCRPTVLAVSGPFKFEYRWRTCLTSSR